MRSTKGIMTVVTAAALAVYFVASAGVALAAAGDAKNGEAIYMKKCWWCHGKEGEADGPGADFMIPPPRNFTDGVYKYKSSAYNEDMDIPRDEDLYRMISEGMPGTSMPEWSKVLDEKQRWDLVAYIKTLTDMFEDAPNPAEMSYGTPVASSADSIAKGKQLFKDAKCFECHGEGGRGNTIKKLKEESGAKLWPRDLSKPWTFRSGSEPKDIFARISAGIPNTPMPAHAADTTGNGKLSVEDRWHVVNYVMSLADERMKTKEGEIVVKGVYRDALPKDENDPAWDIAEGTTFFLAPQIIMNDRMYDPSNDTILVKATFTDKEVAFLLEWNDRTKSVKGDTNAATLAWGDLNPDGVAIQTPLGLDDLATGKPYFGHGDASRPVSIMHWTSGDVEKGQTATMFSSIGAGKKDASDGAAAGFVSTGSYNAGVWKVMMKRSLTTGAKDKDTQFEVGKYIPIAFANWDGSNGEVGSKHTLTTWRWLLLKPETGSAVVMVPLMVFVLLVAGQFVFSLVGRKEED
ncbi:MAG: c-type cytochrome [Nitrospinota bacterium]|nr:c-type cytochrome [Nitrospinota bacterium]